MLLRIGGIAGLIGAALILPLGLLAGIEKQLNAHGMIIFLSVAFVAVACAAFYSYGFVLVGHKYKNGLLVWTSYGAIGLKVAQFVFDVFHYMFGLMNAVGNFLFFIDGLLMIVAGFAFLRLRPVFGTQASFVGRMRITIGAGLVLVVLVRLMLYQLPVIAIWTASAVVFLFLILQIPVVIVGSKILFRAAKLAKR